MCVFVCVGGMWGVVCMCAVVCVCVCVLCTLVYFMIGSPHYLLHAQDDLLNKC